MRATLLLALWAAAVLTPAGAQVPAPDTKAVLADVRANLGRANEQQHRYAYKERRTDLHRNPFGRLGTGATRMYDVTPGDAATVLLKRPLDEQGRPVPGAPVERVERDYRSRSRASTGDTLNVFRFSVTGRQVVNGRSMVIVDFEPRLDAQPRTREGRLARSFRGRAWVDEAARELARVEAVAVEPISFGYGILARLDAGTKASVERRSVEGGIWLPAAIRFTGQGRAMLLRRLTINYAIDYWDYRLVR